MVTCAARDAGSTLCAGEGIASAMTVMVELAPGARVPGGGSAVTVYWPAPEPTGPANAQLMSTFGLAFLTAKVSDSGAVPPQVAGKDRALGVTSGPPPIALPESGTPSGRGAHKTDDVKSVSSPTVLPD